MGFFVMLLIENHFPAFVACKGFISVNNKPDLILLILFLFCLPVFVFAAQHVNFYGIELCISALGQEVVNIQVGIQFRAVLGRPWDCARTISS